MTDFLVEPATKNPIQPSGDFAATPLATGGDRLRQSEKLLRGLTDLSSTICVHAADNFL